MVEGLEMIYTHLAAAIAGAALAFGAAWQAQAWRYDAQIADTAAQHATALASANQKALDQTIQMQRTKDDAIKAAEQRAKTQATAAANARADADRLRDTLYSFRSSLPSLAPAAVIERADTAAELFGQCAGALTDMAAKADAHASDAVMLLEAWPR